MQLFVSSLFSINRVNIEKALCGGWSHGLGSICSGFPFMKGLKFNLMRFSPDKGTYTVTELHGGSNKAHRKTLNSYSITKPYCLHGSMILANT